MGKRELQRPRLGDKRYIRRHDKRSFTNDQLEVGRFLARGLPQTPRSASFRAARLGRPKGRLEVSRPRRRPPANTRTLFRDVQKLIGSGPKLRVEVAETVDSARRFRRGLKSRIQAPWST